MKIGYVGCGKLITPIALAVENLGHHVLVHDPSPVIDEIFSTKKYPHLEEGVNELLQNTKIRNVKLSELVAHSEIIFVGVQTPHSPAHEGIHRLTEDRQDFDYSYLKTAVRQLSFELQYTYKAGKYPIVVVVSTVLPGTMRREILPLLPKGVKLTYNPAFPAMGTVISDFLNPEFVLIGVDKECSTEKLEKFYHSLFVASGNCTVFAEPIPKTVVMSIESAELCKVFYNVSISQKVVLSSALLELCQKIPGCDADDIYSTLALAVKRIVSSAYTKPSFPEGGACHPRDGIAMSWLARRVGLSYDPFGVAISAREKQTEWLAHLIQEESEKRDLPIFVMGKSYKSESNILVGSAAILLANILRENSIQFVHWDPFVDSEPLENKDPGIYFVAMNHKCFKNYEYPKGSVVIDPWRYILDKEGVEIIKVGMGKSDNK